MGKLFKPALKQNSYNVPGSSAKNVHSCVDSWSVFTIGNGLFLWIDGTRASIEFPPSAMVLS